MQLTQTKSDLPFEAIGGKNARQLFGQTKREGLGHGYLFSGQSGIGKKTFARRLAQSLLCQTNANAVLGYCGDCASCKMFTSKTHSDYIELVGEIKIGKTSEKSNTDLTARGLVRSLALHPYHGNYRIAVLGDISFATDESANALLKFFEEPPKGVVIILTTRLPGAILPTIKSRLIEVVFEPIPSHDIVAVLRSEGIDPIAAHNAAVASLGSITAARDLLLDNAASLRSIAFEWLAAAMNGRATELTLEEHGATPAERREWLGRFLDCTRTIARDYTVGVIAGPKAPKLAAELTAKISTLPKRTASQATALLDTMSETIRISQTNVSPALVVEYLRVALTPPTAAR